MRTRANYRRGERCARRVSAPTGRRLSALAATALWLMVAAPSAFALPDFQRFEVGNGLAAAVCISAGANATIESIPAGDDTNPNAVPDEVLAGDDGVCNTAAVGDDVQEIPVGQGLANARYILSGRDQNNVDDDNGICDNAVVFLPSSDDTLLIPAGQSTPQQVGVAPTPPGTVLATTPGGDDVASAIICPGSGNQFESALAGDDVIDLNSFNCFFCVSGNSCFMPGLDGVLDTVPAGNDFALEVILTGIDGVCDSAAAVGDEQQILLGEGFQQLPGAFAATTVCVDSGANGIAESTLCGNGAIDKTPAGLDEQCDDGTLTNGDGCDDDVANGGNCTPSICGNGIITPPEQCDDGNTNNQDMCTAACTIAICGDGITCSAASCTTGPGGGREECDDANAIETDGCTSTCDSQVCGDGTVDPGEVCDDGNQNNNDACLNDCTVAACGDGITCSAASCTTGPGGGPEECDDANAIETDGCTTGCKSLVCGDGSIDPGEDCDDGNQSNKDACLNNCTAAACGDGFKCSVAGCTSGPGGGPEECDPPDGTTCTSECAKVETPCGDGVVNGLCTAPAIKVGETCVANADCDSPNGSGNGACNVVETCDDGNSSNKDGCTNDCQLAECGDGFVHEVGGSEQCDDGNTSPGDGCDPNCQTECGNGLIDGSCSQGLPFGTPCSTNTDCDTVPAAGDGRCAGEACDVGCGVATSDGLCAAGASGGCATNADCDTAPAAGDGLCLGSTCGAGCTAGLTGVAPDEPACTAGSTGAACSVNADCDSAPAVGDGVCAGPSCDTSGAVDLFCGTTAPICSDLCQTTACGNTLQECDEECDAGSANGVAGTGCDVDCTRTGIVGRGELTRPRECVAAWSLDEAPNPLTKKKQTCSDCSGDNKTGVCSAGDVGAACCRPSEAADCDSSLGAGDGLCSTCDADAVSGICTFSLAACLNRLGVPGCDSQRILSFELRRMKVTNQQQALATALITEAVRGLSPGTCTRGVIGAPCTDNQDCESSPGAADGTCSAVILGRCRRGAKNTTCTLGNDFECDRTFGGNNGKCDLGTGVRFLPYISQPDNGGDQQSTCTDSLDIQVERGTSLKLKSLVRRVAGKSDRDGLRLVCK